MKKKILTVLVSAVMVQCTMAQNKQDVESIKSLCGCFEVEFKYVETFSPDKNYQFKDRYVAKALEWGGLVESSDKKLVIQHILVIDDSMIVKHWREDWVYENTSLLQYNHDDQWKKVKLPQQQVAGQWSQSVWEVNDAPRYQGTASWIHQNGLHYWKNTTDAPLPRREYTKRSDYNVLTRGNTLTLTDSGWVHEQDNTKTIRAAGQADRIVALEKGYNIYKKVDDKKCFAAKDWWAKNQAYWNTVRANWDELIAKKDMVTVRREVKNQTLSRRLEDLETTALNNKQPTSLGSQIKKILEEHIAD
jgi:hypothetical protein